MPVLPICPGTDFCVLCACLHLSRVVMFVCSDSIPISNHLCNLAVHECLRAKMWACNVYVCERRVKISHSLHSGRSISHSPQRHTHTHSFTCCHCCSVQTWAILRQLVKHKTKRQTQISNRSTLVRAEMKFGKRVMREIQPYWFTGDEKWKKYPVFVIFFVFNPLEMIKKVLFSHEQFPFPLFNKHWWHLTQN